MLWISKRIIKNYNADGIGAGSISRQEVGTRASVAGICFNTVLCAAKALVGFMAGSVSIIADAVNNLSDAASNIISLFGFKMAAKPADVEHPYGHGRYEYLASLMVAVLILVVGIELAKSSVGKLLNPSPVEFSWLLCVILIASILVKLLMMVFNRQVGAAIESGTLEAAAVDSRNDVLTTSAVLLAAVISYVTGFDLDGWMGLAVALFILYSGVGLVKETIDPLLGGPADPALVELISKKALSYPGILGIHDLAVHDYGPGRIFASLHCEVAAEVDVLESHELIDAIEEDFLHNDGLNVVIHLDPVVTTDPHVAELRSWISADIAQIDERLSIHDLRIVPGENRTNVLFDVVEPYDVAIPENELTDQISQHVASKFPGHVCVLKIDRI